MEKPYRIHRTIVLRIYFRFYLPVMVSHLTREQKSVYGEILQQKLQVKPHIIIYRKLRQLWIFVGKM
jgi:hypothetical protein